MSPQIGFVILAHDEPRRLHRLIATLNRVYDEPPIACHNNFDLNPLTREDFPANVSFVVPYVKTGWSKWSLVDAELRALALLYESGDPDWFTFLSGADYPIRSANEVLSDLYAGEADAYLDWRPVTRSVVPPLDNEPVNPYVRHFSAPEHRYYAWRHYRAARIWVPVIKRDAGSNNGYRVGRHTTYFPFTDPLSPFGSDFKCYSGDHWFTANRRVALTLLNPTQRHIALRRYLRRRTSPEESYFHTVLRNEPGLRIDKNSRRYFRWEDGVHPQILTRDDFPRMLASGANFARKFAPNASVLDDLDGILLT